jgi:outer membrane murein-binding lipoprotein Lpp
MKNTIITIAIAATLAAGTMFTGCTSAAQKEDAAQAKVQDAQQDLDEALNDANTASEKAATVEEWKEFRAVSENQIRNNEIRIVELRKKQNKPGKLFDALYEKKITTLEKQNQEMRARMDAYEKSQSDWETFKSEFNHDMAELGKALNDLTVKNTN